MRRLRRGVLLLALLSLGGCGAPTVRAPLWRSMRYAPRNAMTTGVAVSGNTIYFAYATPDGGLLLQKSGERPVALPRGDLAVAAPGSTSTPIVALQGAVFAATSGGVAEYLGDDAFAPIRQIKNGTPPLALTACGADICFDEMATYDPKTETEIGPAALARLTSEGLEVRTFPHGLRSLPAPIVEAGGALWIAAAPEPETGYYLLKAPLTTLRPRVAKRLPQHLKPIAMTSFDQSPTVLLLQRQTGHIALWHEGHVTWLRLPAAARAATGAGVVTLAAIPGANDYLLGLPAIPDASGTLHAASLWRIDGTSGVGMRLQMPSAPRRFTAAPVFAVLRSSVLAAWQGRYAYFTASSR